MLMQRRSAIILLDLPAVSSLKISIYRVDKLVYKLCGSKLALRPSVNLLIILRKIAGEK